MLSRAPIMRMRVRTPIALSPTSLRYISTSPPPQAPQPQKSSERTPSKTTPTTSPSWLTRKVQSSPTAKRVFMAVATAMGYGSEKQVAGMRAFGMYEKVCAVKPDEDREFWQNQCALPPTFQSWFTITNLHIWLLTTRLRALPPHQGRYYQQALLDHFFIDIEDRIRTVLQPPPTPTVPYTFATSFYANPNAPVAGAKGADGKEKKRSRAPDRIVTRQMKIFKEQWAGMGIALDLGMVKGDMEMAGAVWRNLLGARGAAGIAYPVENSGASAMQNENGNPNKATFRRSVNLVGGEVVNVAKVDWEKESTRDDNSGVHDFTPAEVDRYLEYPATMVDVVAYLRRELKRLEEVSDEDVVRGEWGKLRFGRVGDKVEKE